MSPGIPFLARFGENARECPPGPKLQVGPEGLLRREHADTPFIDEIESLGTNGCGNSVFTIMTKNADDAPDPDTVRFEGFGIETLVTRSESEPIDPDTIRGGAVWALVTSYTGGGRDKPDPDWIRRN